MGRVEGELDLKAEGVRETRTRSERHCLPVEPNACSLRRLRGEFYEAVEILLMR